MSNQEIDDKEEIETVEKCIEEVAKNLSLVKRLSQSKYHNEAALNLFMIVTVCEEMAENAKCAALAEIKLGHEKWKEKKEGRNEQ